RPDRPVPGSSVGSGPDGLGLLEPNPGGCGMGRSASLSTGDALANAIQAYNLPWGPSVSALLPFTSVLETMARDPVWLQQFGNAVLTERPAVMDAIQRMRQRALEYGYLQPNSYMNVVTNAG